MKTLLPILLFVYSFHGNTQILCTKIDSIKLYQIPVNISTVLSLDDFDIKHFDSKYLKKNIFKDTVIINEFSDVIDKLQFDNIRTNNNIDVRILIEIYLNNKIYHKIVIDRYGNIMLNNYFIKRNIRFIDWINLNFLVNNNVGF
jgi:hypothetical protein